MSPPNALLEQAVPATRFRLLEAGRRVVLPVGERLGSPGTVLTSVYFPTTALLGVAAEADGVASAAGTIGSDGFTGIALLFGLGVQRHTLVVDAPGLVTVVPAELVGGALREDPDFAAAAKQFAAATLRQYASAVACTAMHSVRQRLARRVLALWSRIGHPPTLTLSRAAVARFAGADARTAARALRELQSAGAVDAATPALRIDANRLRAMACSCVADDAAGALIAADGVPA